MERGNLVLIRLDGSINEDNRLQERMTPLSGRKILVHLGKVERINSCGVRDWVRWLQGLEAQGNSIHLVQCSPAIISQVNMVRNFCGSRGHVVSFQAPYFCETCDREYRETFLASAVGARPQAPVALCESCGEPMQFDDLEESYFAFLREHSARAVDPEVQASMNRFDDMHLATKALALKEISTGGGSMSSGLGRLSGSPMPFGSGSSGSRTPSRTPSVERRGGEEAVPAVRNDPKR
jgi:anti-anti-sigma regulatory factor